MQTVLVVDDEYGIVEVLEDVLVDAGYRVATAINGRRGMECLAETKPNLVLLDWMMPVLDGSGMLLAMAEHAAYHDIPVIMMSSLPEAVIAHMAKGYAAFLRKPFRIAELVQTITRVLANAV
jgi:DNA-binding response OmpR family regulator